jgi:universal stress protein E
MHAKPAELDTHIVERAREFAEALRGQVHVLHANNPNPFGIVALDPAVDASTLQVGYEHLTRQAREDFKTFADEHQVPRARRHMVDGDPVFVVPKMARKLHASLVVMGAVSRSGLKRVFIGNTAERVLSGLPCDVLVMKPQAFRKRVQPKMRGMNVVATPTVLTLPV